MSHAIAATFVLDVEHLINQVGCQRGVGSHPQEGLDPPYRDKFDNYIGDTGAAPPWCRSGICRSCHPIATFLTPKLSGTRISLSTTTLLQSVSTSMTTHEMFNGSRQEL